MHKSPPLSVPLLHERQLVSQLTTGAQPAIRKSLAIAIHDEPKPFIAILCCHPNGGQLATLIVTLSRRVVQVAARARRVPPSHVALRESQPLAFAGKRHYMELLQAERSGRGRSPLWTLALSRVSPLYATPEIHAVACPAYACDLDMSRPMS
jgi:hypothetical protein